MQVVDQQNRQIHAAQSKVSITKRDKIIDLVRGFAVALMIITHVIAITYKHNGNSDLAENIGLIGGIGSFTTFLFISGIGAFFSFIQYESTDPRLAERRGRIIGGFSKIIIVYFLLGLLSIFVNSSLLSFPPSLTWLETIIDLSFFTIVPEFTEFLIPLAFFLITLIFLRPAYKFLLKFKILGLLLSIIFYTIGYLLYQVNLNSIELNSIKALFAGHSEMHTFPILMYFPIYLFGIYFGEFIATQQSGVTKAKVILLWLIAFAALSVQANMSLNFIDSNLLNYMPNEGRFPPSPAFLVTSLAITFSIYFAITFLYNFTPSFIKALFHFFGTYALEFFFFHTAVLFGFKYLTISEVAPEGQKYSNFIEILIVYIVTLILCIIFTSIKNSVKKWALDELDDFDKERTWWLFTEKAISTIIFVLIFAIGGTTLYKDVFAPKSLADTSTVQFKKRLIREEEWPRWWDNKFSAFRQINITNENPSTLLENSWISFKFDHGSAVVTHGAKSDGKDLRVIYYDLVRAEFKELPFLVDSLNSPNTKISFKLQESINSNETADYYFLYYGNEFLTSFPESKEEPSSSTYSNNISLSDEYTHSIAANINRTWYLKEKEQGYQAATMFLNVSIKNENIVPGSIVTYKIVGTDRFGKMKNVGGEDYQASIVVSDLEPGIYTIQANVTESGESLKIYRSKEIKFFLTYPVYVTWTQDWEGWDVSDANLNDIASISKAYNMPMTHFFNPRIYVQNQYTINPINEERTQHITKWVIDRQKENYEEIGMHVHMWSDMVSAAGVKPKTFPVIQGTYGVDVATYQYSEEELEQVFRWGRDRFGDNDLGVPISYRTGAWMSGPQVLKAAQDVGFLIDSSGRTSGAVNPANRNSTPVPWNLPVTTAPYLPSINDINSWEGERLSIWEYPNNGADSYWFSTQELISRFDQNYPNKGSIVTRPQVVTYLSHPHWFLSQDSGKIRSLFSYTGKYLYSNDQGPVIYATLETIYFEWDKEKFYNGN